MKKMIVLFAAVMAMMAMTGCEKEVKYDEEIKAKSETLVAFESIRLHFLVVLKEEKNEVAQYS